MLCKEEKNVIRVLHSTTDWLPQTQTWLFSQIKFLPKHIQNYIICEKTENLDQFLVSNLEALEDQIFLRRIWDKGLIKLGIRNYSGLLLAKAKEIGAHILHSHFGNMGWANLYIANKFLLKHIVTFYGVDVNYLPKQDARWYMRYKQLFENACFVLCEGKHMASCLNDLGCPKEKILIQHLGVDLSTLDFKPRAWNGKEKLRVLIAASFKEKKGIPYALQALNFFINYIPMEITIIGDASNEPRSREEKRKILETIKRLNLRPYIRLMGYQSYSTLLEEAYKHHIFVLPSVTAADGDTEGGAPVVLIEMMASGMPIVSTCHCDIPEVVRYRERCLLANEKNVDELIGILKWWLENPEKWYEYLKAGREHVEREFDAQLQGHKLALIYRDAVKNKSI